MEFNFVVKDDRLIGGSTLAGNSGNRNTYICRFDIDCDDGYTWFCVFKKGDSVYQKIIENGMCAFPQEVTETKGTLEVGCYGISGSMRISTNWLVFEIKEGAYCEATSPKEPEPDVWEELVLKTIPYIGENGNWYVYDNEICEYKDTGVSSCGEKGEKGEKGDRGEQGIPGTSDAANALKKTVCGTEVVLSNVSPIEHILDIKVKSKNIAYDCQAFNTSAGNGTVAKASFSWEKGKTYTMSFDTEDTRTDGNENGTRINFVTYNRPVALISSGSIRADGGRKTFVFTAIEDYTSVGATILQLPQSEKNDSGLCSNIMIEEGEVATEYTPTVKDLAEVLIEITDGNGRFEELYPDSDGALKDAISSHPEMTIRAMSNGVLVDIEYNRDINKAFYELEEKIANAIISLGGNV